MPEADGEISGLPGICVFSRGPDGEATDTAMFGLAHGAVLLAPAENALNHRPA